MRICELGFAQQLLIWACRSWLTGEDAWNRVTFELSAVLGPRTGGVIAQALSSFLTILDGSSNRDISIGRIGCRRVCADELMILKVMALCQDGPGDAARHMLAQRLPPTAARIAGDYGAAAATALAASGYPLCHDRAGDAPGSARRYVHTATQTMQ